MSMFLRNRILLALGAGGILALATPALAASEDTGKDLPTCSATVTDHCMQRGGGGHGAMGHHHMGKHHGTRHHGKHHGAKHHMSGHHMNGSAPAAGDHKPAAKPKP